MRLLLCMVALCCAAVANGEDDVATYLQNISVTISAGGAQGSGVAFVRDRTTFVWTAGHVVDGLRKTRQVVDPQSGTNRTIVEFDDPSVVKHLIEDGRTIGRIQLDAEVVRYSNADDGEDLALLKVRKKDYIKDSARFYLKPEQPKIGTRLFHVGSLLGEDGANSMTSGILSQHGRLLNKKTFTQTTVVAFPGSSGGGVYLESGDYIGMVVRGAGEGFNLIVPVTRMRDWAKRSNIEWAIDPAVKMPADAELEKLPIEDIGHVWGDDAKKAEAKSRPVAPDLPVDPSTVVSTLEYRR